MKISQKQLKQIIKEETQRMLKEEWTSADDGASASAGRDESKYAKIVGDVINRGKAFAYDGNYANDETWSIMLDTIDLDPDALIKQLASALASAAMFK
jgi:hypothetical protein